MNILLVCSAGMSTSLLVTRMQAESQKRELSDTIRAISVDALEQHIDDCDVVLIGPQIRYKEKKIVPLVAAKGKGCAVIDPVCYGLVDGKKVLDQAYKIKK